MIENLHHTLLLGDELDAAAERIITLVNESLPAEPLLAPLITLIGKDRAQIQSVLVRVRGSARTAAITEADAVRDDAFIALRSRCEEATRRRSSPDLMAAGELLLRLIRAQGYSLHSFGYARETGALNSLFTAFATADAPAALTAIGAGELLTELRASQVAFEAELNARGDELAAEDYPLLAAAKGTLGNRLQLLLGLIGSLDEADTTDARPALDTLILRLNEAITLILTPARGRRTRRNAPDTPPAPVPTV
ncbi:MAG: DUF6261 family protein [Luteolibacter sp.]|uniref:DUF6261 family protein n=1 Tax=Luteolibacter sp. TaxID=1962973 RepID=UPI003265B827